MNYPGRNQQLSWYAVGTIPAEKFLGDTMVSVRTVTDAWHALVFLLLYGFVATAIAPRFTPYPRVVAALVVSIIVFAALDMLPALARGNRPLIDTNSRIHSVRGLIVLILIVLVTAVTADWLRVTTDFAEVAVTMIGVVVGSVVVLGPVVAYHWRRSEAGQQST